MSETSEKIADFKSGGQWPLAPQPAPWINQIVIARLYNLGDYEHKRIELMVQMPYGQDVGKTLTNLEGILERFEHKAPNNLECFPFSNYVENAKLSDEDWQLQRGDVWRAEKENEAKLLQLAKEENAAWEAKQAELRSLLNRLGVQ